MESQIGQELCEIGFFVEKILWFFVAKMLEGIEGDEKETEVESSFEPLIHGK